MWRKHGDGGSGCGRIWSAIWLVMVAMASLGWSAETSAVPVADSPFTIGASREMTDFFTNRIQPVLVENCYECHAGKKHYGGLKVDSLAALLAGGHDEGPAVIPWNAAKSSLIRAVRYEGDSDLNMPPKKKLPDAVIADLVRWVDAGAPWPTGVAMPVAKAEPSPPLLGKLHPAVVHVPIGVLLLAALFELLAWWRGEAWRPAVLVALTVAMGGAGLAVASGLAAETSAGNPLIERHEQLAWITLGLISTALVVTWIGGRHLRWRWIGRVLLALAVVAVGLTGHLGGELVHGPWW